MREVPSVFRVRLQVTDLEAGAAFYSTLLGAPGKRVFGDLHYFECGSVILALVQTNNPRPGPETLYFTVDQIEAVHKKAQSLDCLSKGTVHGDDAGQVVKRPWGERSFYAQDPFGNRLCMVESSTAFRGA